MSASPVAWSTRYRWGTSYSADSVEWCPLEPYTDIMVCGTYQLDQSDGAKPETKQKRRGCIHLFKITAETADISPIYTIETSGILDMKWCYHLVHDRVLLAVVTSDGYLKLYALVSIGDSVMKLELWTEMKIEQGTLALSVDWSTNKLRSGEPRLVVSDSSGTVTVLKVHEGLEKIGTWRTHRYEAWIGAFNYWEPDVFYSGGDDCSFRSYDLRAPGAVVAHYTTHDAGVTCIRSHTDLQYNLLTGSYDEKVRLWDTRQLKRPVCEVATGGGVWRVKLHPRRQDVLVAACMYAGFRLLRTDGQADMSVIYNYTEHESIAYGVDWKHSEESVVGTCSFYDCKLHVSEVQL